MDTPAQPASMGEDTTIRVSKDLADELYRRKGRTRSYEEYIWRLLDRVDHLEAAAEAEDGPGSTPDPEPEEAAAEPEPNDGDDEGGGTNQDMSEPERILRDLGLPGSGERLDERIDATLAMYDYLREFPGEPQDKATLLAVVERKGYAHGYSDLESYWSNWVKKNKSQGRPNALTSLPGVELVGDDYRYTRGRSQ